METCKTCRWWRRVPNYARFSAGICTTPAWLEMQRTFVGPHMGEFEGQWRTGLKGACSEHAPVEEKGGES